MLLMG